MIKNLSSYLYTIIFAVLFIIILNLYNKLRKVEIQILATRELKTVIDNTDIQVNSINKRVDEMDKKLTKIPEPVPVPVPVQEESFPDLEAGKPIQAEFDFIQQCLNEMLSSTRPSFLPTPFQQVPTPFPHAQPEIYEYAQPHHESNTARPELKRQEEFIEMDDESIEDLEPEMKTKNTIDI